MIKFLNLKKKKQIKIYFICQYIQGYNKICDVIEKMKSDSKIDVKVIAFPNDIYMFPKNNEYDFWYSKFGDITINSVEGDKWFNLEKEKPDYVFIQRPYDNYLPSEYSVENIKKYTKICYIPYGFELINLRDVAMPDFFVKNVSLFFCTQSEEYNYCKHIIDNTNDIFERKVYNLGYPSLYNIIKKINISKSAYKKIERKTNLNVLWTPRWTTDYKLCKTSFFDYKDDMVNYMKNQQNINFVFRPHPLAFNNFIQTGLMTKKQVDSYLKNYKKSNMVYDCSSDYYDTFIDSDVLITDFSSIIIEYFLLNKPIIYCYKKIDNMTMLMKEMIDCFYCVDNFDEIKNTLENLQKGIDPLKNKREKLINKILENYKEDVSVKIVNEIKKDFYN